ncbi:CDP-alcohol phosphatidyltransferase [Luteitalea pratensis]|uniref:CDP-alcohol phosphatidyltransferase n=1 Tax=Luteitalea pratensis TaxID=1855912 RepID=A0A143PJQ7_LUTPR|nr:CDP-alcohol phosphatidyltransferase family protein [Luteitalea pratensis]AMY08014.1 CDP-alcohol phosphatidyltransferase [Luteitalea pratensis]
MSVTTVPAPAGTHARQNASPLAAVEKRLLVWIAQRLPRAIGSDHLTLLGLLSMLGVGLAFAASSRDSRLLYLVPVLLALNWFGDSLDGTVARVRNRQRPRYGYYVDHVVDIVGAVALFSGLALSGGMAPLLAMALLVAYLAAMAEVFLATHVTRVFRLASFGFGPTELRIVLAAGALALVGRPTVGVPGVGRVALFDLGGFIATAGIVCAFMFSAVRTALALAREERIAP